jgi:hypothetical protein
LATRILVYFFKLLLIKSLSVLGFLTDERLQFYNIELPVLLFLAQYLADQIKVRVLPPAKNYQHGKPVSALPEGIGLKYAAFLLFIFVFSARMRLGYIFPIPVVLPLSLIVFCYVG